MRSSVAERNSGRNPAQVPMTSDSVSGVIERAVHRAEEVRGVVGGALRIVDIAVVIGVGSADVRVLPPRNHEDRTVVTGDGYHHRDLVAHLVPRHGDVYTLRRTERRRVRAFVECAHFVGPDAAGIHDDARSDVDVSSVRGTVGDVNAHSRHAPGRRLVHGDGRRVVHDHRAVLDVAVRASASVRRASSACASKYR